jgi:phage gpG-like protein
MSDPWIKVNFSKLPEEINVELRAKGSRLREVLFTKVSALTYLLQGKIINKLSGPVLKRKTGALAASVTAETTSDAQTITGKVSIPAGPSRDVALIHTLGRTTPYQIMAVKGNALKFLLNGKAFRKSVVHPAIPAKPFMQDTLDENRQDIIEQLAKSVAQVLAGK